MTIDCRLFDSFLDKYGEKKTLRLFKSLHMEREHLRSEHQLFPFPSYAAKFLDVVFNPRMFVNVTDEGIRAFRDEYFSMLDKRHVTIDSKHYLSLEKVDEKMKELLEKHHVADGN